MLKDTNVAPVSTAPARLHCYLLEKAQCGLLKPVLRQGYQVFCPVVIYIFTADLSKTLTSAVTYKKKKKWNHWVLREPCALVTTVQSVNQGAVGIQAKTQHTALESLFVLCFMLCFHFSVRHTCLVTRQTQCSSLMGSEFKAIILSMWRIPRTLPGKCALCVLFLLFLVCVLVISVQVVHMFNTFQWFVLTSIGYEGCCCK